MTHFEPWVASPPDIVATMAGLRASRPSWQGRQYPDVTPILAAFPVSMKINTEAQEVALVDRLDAAFTKLERPPQ